MKKSQLPQKLHLVGATKTQKTPLPVNLSLVKDTALIFRALLNDFRLEILELIHEKKSVSVTAIYTALKYTQAVTSHQLRILRDAGIVNNVKRGKEVLYSINYPRLEQIQTLCMDFNNPNQ